MSQAAKQDVEMTPEVFLKMMFLNGKEGVLRKSASVWMIFSPVKNSTTITELQNLIVFGEWTFFSDWSYQRQLEHYLNYENEIESDL